jgi:glycine cleavage system T protein (aminomethyltransferase)
MAVADLKRTPLEAEHRALGAKIGPFAGWAMPIEYGGALSEHRAVRERAGIFDLTHLGKVDVTGAGALELLQGLVTGDLSKLDVGEAQYGMVLNRRGGVVDDLIVYRLEEERYFVVPNAANSTTVLHMLEEAKTSDPVHLVFHQDWCFLAVQGPRSIEVVSKLFPVAEGLTFLRCTETEFRRRPVILTRSGYTGEVGFELFTYQDIAFDLWRALMEAGEEFQIEPCGLAARDVLRLEMGYPLHGQELSEDRTPFEAGLGWAVDIDKGEFVGRAALVRQLKEGLPARLRALRMRGKLIPRPHYAVYEGDEHIGETSSGTFSPMLRTGVALAFLSPADAHDVGSVVEVDVRGRRGEADVVRTPFVERSPK